MLVSDYIVEFFIAKGISDVFGYPGGMVTSLMESLRTHGGEIRAHIAYHEQAAAFAACGYAQTSGKPGVAYATSGPGATNLITGICNAYFDSIPCIFITGQVNTNESKQGYSVRQRGFQETEIIPMVSNVTKYAVQLQTPAQICCCMEKAYNMAISGRPGPVLLDIPMDIMRAEFTVSSGDVTLLDNVTGNMGNAAVESIQQALKQAKRPVFLFGNGIKAARCQELSRKITEHLDIPIVSSMLAVDIFRNSSHYFGFIGAYGDRTANFIVAKADLIIAIGSRLDVRQVGAKRREFAPNAQIIRFDIDTGEFTYPVHENEMQIQASIQEAFSALDSISETASDYSDWLFVCRQIKSKLVGIDDRAPNQIMRRLGEISADMAAITADVGQNQVWVAQSFAFRRNQRGLFSGGHGAMGYALPAAIGACYGLGRKSVLCIAGDGGMQMNIQELQWVARERLPVKIVVINNEALGMIRHFQEMYFQGNYFQTMEAGGYTAPSFRHIAEAYGISACEITNMSQLVPTLFEGEKPLLVEVILRKNTYVFPKLEFGKPMQDQNPLLDRELYEEIMAL